MAKQKKIVFEIQDISLVRLQCNNPSCLQKVGVHLGNGRIPDNCSYCGHPWLTQPIGAPAPNEQLLMIALHKIFQGENSEGFSVKFEMADFD